MSTDQCALDDNSNLLDAQDITWYNDPDDEAPLHSLGGVKTDAADPPPGGLRRGTRQHNSGRLASITAAEKLDEHGNLTKKFVERQSEKIRTIRRYKKKAKTDVTINDNDSGDEDYTDSGSVSESDDSDDDNGTIITNAELAESLSSKMIPMTGRHSGTRKRKSVASIGSNDVDYSGTPQAALNSEENIDESISKTRTSKSGSKRNPIYHFFEAVECGADGRRGNPGDRHYKCYHGSHKVITLKASMKSNLSGLIKTLKEASSSMHTFFLLLKDRCTDEPITQEEIGIASGQVPIDARKSAEVLARLKERSENIEKAFQRQREAAVAPWDQSHFESLLIKWIIATDKAFEEVENPEFIDLLTYLRHATPSLHIPGRNSVKRRVMEM
ncbi:hypothetical protein H0H92_010023, partial [Tricholoma furcatifolium]